MTQGQLVGVMNDAARPGDTIIAAAGSPPGDLHSLWDATNGRKCHLEFGYSCMGYELPASLGVRMAEEQGEVIVFIGDGTYLMNPTELVTAARERFKITVVISENHGYQCIRNLQMNRVGHPLGTEFKIRDVKTNSIEEGDYVVLDLAKNAEGMGARVWNVRTPAEVCKALREARDEKGPCVIIAETEKHKFIPGSGLWWDVVVAESTKDTVTQKLRADYEENRDKLQRLYY